MNARFAIKARFGVMARYVGSLGLGALLAPGFGACGGEVMVGNVDDGTGGNDGKAALECAENDALVRDGRARWLATDNDFGDLAGSRWEGTMKDLPTLVLELGADQTGSLVVGAPAAPPSDPDMGYLVTADPFPIGGTFPLHGGSFDGAELLLPLPPDVPYDDWCALQPPMALNGDDPCWFGLSNGADCTNGKTCELYFGRTVDISWVDTTDCGCASTDCFAYVQWPTWEVGETWKDLENYYDLQVLRLSYDSETDTLKGGYFPEGSPPPAGVDGIQAKFVRAE